MGIRSFFAPLFSLLLALTSFGQAGETTVTVAPGVEGDLALPNSGMPRGGVLLLHGWAGQRNEVGDMFKRTAEALAQEGIASLRIDFRGEGERNGHRLTSTFAGRIADAEAGLKMLQTRFPDAKLGVIGFSLGGATTLALTGRHPTEISSIALWSASGNLGADFFKNAENAALFREVVEQGEAVWHTWSDITVTREHLLGMIGYDLLGPMKAYRGALLAIRGSEDYLTRYEDQFLAAASGDPEEFRIIGGADHIYHAFDPASTEDDRVIAATVEWFTKTL